MRQQSSSVPLACLHILHMQLCCYASLIFYASYITNDNSSMTSLKLGLGPICKKAAIIFLACWVGGKLALGGFSDKKIIVSHGMIYQAVI